VLPALKVLDGEASQQVKDKKQKRRAKTIEQNKAKLAAEKEVDVPDSKSKPKPKRAKRDPAASQPLGKPRRAKSKAARAALKEPAAEVATVVQSKPSKPSKPVKPGQVGSQGKTAIAIARPETSSKPAAKVAPTTAAPSQPKAKNASIASKPAPGVDAVKAPQAGTVAVKTIRSKAKRKKVDMSLLATDTSDGLGLSGW
jgi:hypothetical protein